MTDEETSAQVDFERLFQAMMEELCTSHPEIVAECKPGILWRPLDDERGEAFMIAKDDGTPRVLGTFPVKWVIRLQG